MMICFVLLASLFSFLDPPMERFADAYCAQINAERLLSHTKARVKSEMQLEEERDWRDRPSQYADMDWREAANRSERINEEMRKKMDANSMAWDAQFNAIIEENKNRTNEYEIRKRLFRRNNPTPNSTQSEAIEKFKANKYKLEKLPSKYKEVLVDFLQTNSSDWNHYVIEHYKKGKPLKRIY